MQALAGLGVSRRARREGSKMPTPHRVSQRSKRPAPRAAAVEIGAGVRMHCQEIDDDFAILRFACGAPSDRAGESKSGATLGDRRRARRPPGQS
jgi:hypothetical protein